MKKSIGAVVPCLDKRGGVRHFLEVGNELVKRGYDYTIFTDDPAEKLDWFKFNGKIEDWRNGVRAEILLVGDPQLLQVADKMWGNIYVWVLGGGPYKDMYKPYIGKFPFLLNNRHHLKDYPNGHIVELGVSTVHFKPKKRVVLFYSGGERGLHKQGHIIHNALHDVKGIKLVELKGLNNDELARAYRKGDYFVAWESHGGFSNTAAEAIASGLTVVTNGNNCEPFIEKCIVIKTQEKLREFFEDPMKNNTWEKTVDQLLKVIRA